MAKLSKTQTKERIGLLRKELEKHNYNYYVLNSPTISDFEFDLLMQELQALEKLYPEFASKDSPAVKVGSDITSSPTEFVQTAHKYQMLSLGNTTYLLAGEKAGPEKLRKAEKLGVKIISEEEFNALV